MKNEILLLCCIILCITVFSACSSFYSNEFDYSSGIINEIFAAIKTYDENKMVDIFAPASTVDKESFLKSVNELFEYCGACEVLSLKLGTINSDVLSENGNRKLIYVFSYEVITNTDAYRVFIKATRTDSLNEKNVGVNSLYIIRFEDDTDTSTAYKGDEKYTEGINIGIKSIDNSFTTSTVNDIITAVESKNATELKELFAKSAFESEEIFYKAFQELTQYYISGEIISLEMMKVEGNIKNQKEAKYGKFFFSYDITNSNEKYRLCGVITVIDNENNENIGLNSLYIIKYDDDTAASHYFADEKFESGIHIAVARDCKN